MKPTFPTVCPLPWTRTLGILVGSLLQRASAEGVWSHLGGPGGAAETWR